MDKDLRKHKRLAVAVDVTWTIENQGLSGNGKLVDVSLLGAGLQIEGAFATTGNVLLRLHSPDVEVLPALARLRWARQLTEQPPTYLCGVIFQVALSTEWSDWVKEAEQRSRASDSDD